jgi:hypothetical protein
MGHDYVAVGHVTIDVLEDGSRAPGGTVLFSALQAARLGCRALIVTAGVPGEIEAMLEPYLGELDLQVLPAAMTTTLETLGAGDERRQRVLAWAGPVEPPEQPDTAILHLAPVARELPACWSAASTFRGLTPQGLLRRWSSDAPEIELAPAGPEALVQIGACNAIVIGAGERSAGAELIEAGLAGGALVAITDGARPGTLLLGGGESLPTPVMALEDPLEDLGAGDVYAAAMFVELAGGSSPAAAAAFAAAAAAARMLSRGAQAIGSRAAIEARMSGATDRA